MLLEPLRPSLVEMNTMRLFLLGGNHARSTDEQRLPWSQRSVRDRPMRGAHAPKELGVGQSIRIRKRCVEEGVESALNRKKQLRRRQKRLDGEGEARLIAMACGEPPEGRASWTLKLLADQLVECEIVGVDQGLWPSFIPRDRDGRRTGGNGRTMGMRFWWWMRRANRWRRECPPRSWYERNDLFALPRMAPRQRASPTRM